VVGTLGTAFGEDHLGALRRLADRVVLVYDADPAGQNAADRALEFFLGSDLDLRVLTLPAKLDPCDYLLEEGAGAFRALVEGAADPLAYLIARAAQRFDLESGEGSRRAAEWILGLMSRVPATHHLGLEVKQAKVLDTLSHRLHVPLETLDRLRRQLRRPAGKAKTVEVPARTTPEASLDNRSVDAGSLATPIRQNELDRTDLELIQIVLAEPETVKWLRGRLDPAALQDAPLRQILEVCFDLQKDDEISNYANLMVRLDDPAIRSLTASLLADSALSMPDSGRFPDSVDFRPAPWRERLEQLLVVFDERKRLARLRDVKRSLDKTDKHANPEAYGALELEYLRLLTPDRTRKS
jgi:DNA primase